MAKKFIGDRELKLVESWTKELVQGTVDQELIYYAISYEESRVHDVYDEAVYKSFLEPVRFNGRVSFEQTSTETKNGALDSNYRMTVSCHARELIERNIEPREGHFVEFGQVMFEITSVTRPQMAFGQANDKINVKLTCVPTREQQFKADSSIAESVDNTHPVERSRPRTLGDGL